MSIDLQLRSPRYLTKDLEDIFALGWTTIKRYTAYIWYRTHVEGNFASDDRKKRILIFLTHKKE